MLSKNYYILFCDSRIMFDHTFHLVGMVIIVLVCLDYHLVGMVIIVLVCLDYQ